MWWSGPSDIYKLFDAVLQSCIPAQYSKRSHVLSYTLLKISIKFGILQQLLDISNVCPGKSHFGIFTEMSIISTIVWIVLIKISCPWESFVRDQKFTSPSSPNISCWKTLDLNTSCSFTLKNNQPSSGCSSPWQFQAQKPLTGKAIELQSFMEANIIPGADWNNLPRLSLITCSSHCRVFAWGHGLQKVVGNKLLLYQLPISYFLIELAG